MPYGKGTIAMGVCLRICIAIMMITSTPCLSFSVELIHTIQIGSHLSEQRARRQYGAVLTMLKEKEKSYLRIEHLDRYYALRLGNFATPREAKNLYAKVISSYPDAQLLKAYVNHNRLIEMYGSAAAKKLVAPPLEPKKEPATTPEKRQEVSRQKASEETVPAAVEPNEKPAIGSEENPEIEAQVVVKGSTAEVVAEVKSPLENVEVTAPAKPTAAGEIAVSPTEASSSLLSPRNFIIMATALTLIMLIFLVRSRGALSKSQSRRTVLIDERPAESIKDNAAPEGEQNAPVYALQSEVATTGQEHSPLPQDAVGVDSDSKVSGAEKAENFPGKEVPAAELVAEKNTEASESEDPALIEVKPLATNPPVAETPDRKKAQLVKREEENRLTRALEAVTLGKDKR